MEAVVVGHLESHQGERLGTSLVHKGVDHKEVVVVAHHKAAVLWDREPAGILPADHRNPADSSTGADRFDTGRMLAPGSDIHHGACHWNFPDVEVEKRFDIRNWESGVACVVNRAAEKMSCKKSRDFHRSLPVIQDHGFESHSRWIRRSCRDHQALHESAQYPFAQYPFRRLSYDCGQLGQKQS